MQSRILVIEPDDEAAGAFTKALADEGHDVTVAARGDEGFARAKNQLFDVIITALNVPVLSGLDIARQLHSLKPKLPVIMMTAYATSASAIQASRYGVLEFLYKPFKPPQLLAAVAKALASSQSGEPTLQLTTLNPVESRIVGGSSAMQQLYKEIGRAASSSLPVLITGETGTGKELVARAVHEYSNRADQPFVPVNCTAIPDSLMESELFGHERGAFTGANVRRIGRFEQAKGGTVFLDEIGDTTPATQVKLLRVIQEKDIQRVGGNERIKVNARIVSATHRDLYKAIKEKLFREDLFYRMTGFVVHVPSLRERIEDIPVLVNCFLQNFALEAGVEIPSIHSRAVDYLKQQSWRGNVRQLQNVIGHALSLAGHRPTSLADVQQAFRRGSTTSAGSAVTDYLRDLFLKAQKGEIKNLHAQIINNMEQDLFVIAFEAAKGNQAKVARWLQLDRRTVRDKLSQFGLL